MHPGRSAHPQWAALDGGGHLLFGVAAFSVVEPTVLGRIGSRWCGRMVGARVMRAQ